MNRTLVLILAFLVLTVGSFVWFVATWDPSKEEPVTSIEFLPNHGDYT